MTLFGLLIVPLANAQSSRPVQADIPFDFGVANRVMPAGNYRLTYSHDNKTLSIRGLDQNAKAAVITYALQDKWPQQNKATRLTFNRVGGTYFLSQMFHGQGLLTGSEVPRSRSERDLIARIPALGVERALITIPAR
jgi:hypothetical protein